LANWDDGEFQFNEKLRQTRRKRQLYLLLAVVILGICGFGIYKIVDFRTPKLIVINDATHHEYCSITVHDQESGRIVVNIAMAGDTATIRLEPGKYVAKFNCATGSADPLEFEIDYGGVQTLTIY
jgi:hypothetical protein